MNVGQLRKFMLQLDSTDIPDDAPILITGRHSMHTAQAEVMPIHPVNALGQAQMDPAHANQLYALVFQDTSTG